MEFTIWDQKGKVRMEKTIYTREYAVLIHLLRVARQQAGLTQVELAKKVGQTQSFITKIERGERRLDVVQLRTICQLFGMSFPDFARRFERELAKRK